ncbi:hypothetical protein PAAG_01235 [Paracoccidioides lutzii Pb01]|uniref:Uncharacterized protein n=1 Tax=Paracoccidioides lutzii (strain ATCC MYA-826 / Pb01) TaxID=502779 RepID=C1GRU0_PARBA|nr:hypothetical protein PAAG_01235 [Paracoccidioides lutzii Pb01]EEH38314.2 hypothetical protein PAAG_01235 [Paracoccidioides lutzii Pb01]
MMEPQPEAMFRDLHSSIASGELTFPVTLNVQFCIAIIPLAVDKRHVVSERMRAELTCQEGDDRVRRILHPYKALSAMLHWHLKCALFVTLFDLRSPYPGTTQQDAVNIERKDQQLMRP